ncbi:Uma2 family endonuclease [Sphingomonas bacterium]|uniref:Uma2 family endonuclease n=1 Tax=Sphingomonas bacterium TaxID=1895847 RepID=UPI001577009E|nr:Uma2 family endonuclease [Sphingomonas bacterium]
MASSALQHPRLLTVEEFLEIDFGPGLKAELDRGVIQMMAGGTRDHARVQGNVLAYLHAALRGSGCRTYGSDMKVRSDDRSVRYPDVTVDCGAPGDAGSDQFLHAPRVIVEILSPSTRTTDAGVKLDEYRSIDTVETIALVDPETERLRVLQRAGPQSWNDTAFVAPAALDLPSLGVSMPHAEIFARD